MDTRIYLIVHVHTSQLPAMVLFLATQEVVTRFDAHSLHHACLVESQTLLDHIELNERAVSLFVIGNEVQVILRAL